MAIWDSKGFVLEYEYTAAQFSHVVAALRTLGSAKDAAMYVNTSGPGASSASVYTVTAGRSASGISAMFSPTGTFG